MTHPDPTIRAQELGAAMRSLREQAELTLAEVAARIDASPSKLSRIETGARNAPVEDVAALLAVYGVTGQQRTELLDLARGCGQRGWWQRDRPDFPQRQRTLISLERRATRIVNFEGMVVPGLLQTGEYTRAIMAESGMVPENEIESRMVTRLQRRSILRRPYPPQLIAIIDELVLHRLAGGTDVLRRQLDQLLIHAQHPAVTIRVLPNVSAHAGTIGSFQLIHQSHGPRVVYLENLTSSLFMEDRAEVDTYELAIRRLLEAALDQSASINLISTLAVQLDRPDTTPTRGICEAAEHVTHHMAQEQLQQLQGELRRSRLSR